MTSSKYPDEVVLQEAAIGERYKARIVEGKGGPVLDVREFVEANERSTFQGFTRKGIRVKQADAPALAGIVAKFMAMGAKVAVLLAVVLLGTGCVSTVVATTDAKFAKAGIIRTINPNSVIGCESKGMIAGISPHGFAMMDAGELLVAEMKRKEANTLLLTSITGTDFSRGRNFGSGEAYACPATPATVAR